MASVQTGDVLQITVQQRMFQQRILSVFHAQVIATGNDTDYVTGYGKLANDLALEFNAGGMFADWLAEVTENLHVETVRVQRVSPNRQIYLAAAVNLTGEVVAGAEQTANLAMSITKRTEFVGRDAVGRVQVAGLPNSAMADGLWTPAAILNMNAAFIWLTDDYIAPTEGLQIQWGVYNPLNVSPFKEIIDIDVKNTVRTMSRRTVGRGE